MPRLPSALLFLVLVALVPAASAQENAPVRPAAPDEALLLGIRYQESISKVPPYYAGRADSLARPAYHTLLITRRGNRIALVGSADGLVVPRGNDFWRIGTKRSVYNDWVEDFIWSAPPGEAPKLAGIQAFNGEYCRGNRVQKILYAGESYLTLEQFSAGYCEGAAHPWVFNNLAVVPIDSTTHIGLFISEVLGEAGEEAFFDAAKAFRERITDPERRERYAEFPDPANWGLVRRDGRWAVVGRLDAASEVTQGAYADFSVPLSPPASLVGRNDLFPSWQQIRAFAPDAVDAFTSPGRDFVVIFHRTLLTAHPIVEGEIGPAAVTLRLRQQARPVMSRWATGARAQRWVERMNRAVPSPATGHAASASTRVRP